MFRITRVCRLAIVAVVGFMLYGCASIMSGGEQKIGIRSDPSDAVIKVYDSSGGIVFQSQTPATAILKKSQGYFQSANYRVVIEKPGYRKHEMVLSGNLNVGWYLFGNFLLGGWIGWLIVDPMTGAMWTLSPENVGANLIRENASLDQAGGLMIVLLEDVPAALLPRMERVMLPGS